MGLPCSESMLNRAMAPINPVYPWINNHNCGHCDRGIMKVIKGYELKKGLFGPKRVPTVELQVCDSCKGWGVHTKLCVVCNGKRRLIEEEAVLTDQYKEKACWRCNGSKVLSMCPTCKTEQVLCFECTGSGVLQERIYAKQAVDRGPCYACKVFGDSTGQIPAWFDKSFDGRGVEPFLDRLTHSALLR